MTWFDAKRMNLPVFYRCGIALFFVQIFFGFPFFMICPAIAATDAPSDAGPRIEWVKSFDQGTGGGIHSITATSDGGAVATGYFISSSGMSGISVIKMDTDGKKMWDWTETETSYEGYSVIETPDKGFAIVGSSNNTLTNGIFLLKLDQSGKKTWMRVFRNGERCDGNSVSGTRDGGFIIAGSVFRGDTPTSSLWDGYIIKTNADGMEQWTRLFTGEKNDFANFIRQTEDGGYIVSGTTESYGSAEGAKAFLLKMNGFGDEEWFATYGSGLENEKISVIQKGDGEYILMGTADSVKTTDGGKDLFLILTDDLGKEQWEKTFIGAGKTRGNLLVLTADGITIIAGSFQGSEQEKTGEITVYDIDFDGRENQNITFSLGQPIAIQDIALAPSEGFFVTGILTDPKTFQKKQTAIIKILKSPSHNESSQKNQFDLTIITRETINGKIIGGAHVYLDGRSVGTTSEQDGKQILTDIGRGVHSVRVAKTGYQEVTRSVDMTEKKQVSVLLNRSKIIPLQIHGSTEEKIDIIFVASNTTYNCNSRTKIPISLYTGDEQRFVTHVNDKIHNIFFKMDVLTSGFVGLPDDFRQRFNFYYYWDEENFADAFDGCAGKLPDEFWDNAPFTDVAVIMYPSYEGIYSGSPCEPNGCANGLGPGSGSWLKAPADASMIFLHESGHVVFGLIDTYCGETYYVENSPFPNVWSTEESCIKNAEQEHWDTSACRQILKPANSRSKDPCVKNFWKADTDPDIMGSGAYSGRFGNASTTRIRYIFNTINRWEI
jgi:hypothetical protein